MAPPAHTANGEVTDDEDDNIDHVHMASLRVSDSPDHSPVLVRLAPAFIGKVVASMLVTKRVGQFTGVPTRVNLIQLEAPRMDP
jgi:hypothetical protein